MSKGASSYFSLCTLVLHLVVVVLLLSVGSFPVAHAQNHLAQDAMATNKPVPMIGKPAPDFKGALVKGDRGLGCVRTYMCFMLERIGRTAHGIFFFPCVNVWTRSVYVICET